jgi:hypothetical protein
MVTAGHVCSHAHGDRTEEQSEYIVVRVWLRSSDFKSYQESDKSAHGPDALNAKGNLMKIT